MNVKRMETGPVDLTIDGNEYAELRERINALEAENVKLRAALIPEWSAGGYWCVICHEWGTARGDLKHLRGCAGEWVR